MGKHVKIGQILEVTFAPARWSAQTQEPINGRPAYATDSGPTPLSGDRWQVMVVGMNTRRTAYFVEPLVLLEAADGLGDLLRPHAPFFHEYIREAEARLSHLLSDVGTGNADDDDADVLEEILDDRLLPDGYKASVISRFVEVHLASPAAC